MSKRASLDPDRDWCVCRKPDDGKFMVECDRCNEWFHGACLGIQPEEEEELKKDESKWVCTKCQLKSPKKSDETAQSPSKSQTDVGILEKKRDQELAQLTLEEEKQRIDFEALEELHKEEIAASLEREKKSKEMIAKRRAQRLYEVELQARRKAIGERYEVVEDVSKEPLVPPKDEDVLDWLDKNSGGGERETSQRKSESPSGEKTDDKVDKVEEKAEANPQTSSFTADLKSILALQSMPKELPTFSGNPEDWLIFLGQYKRTTRVGKISNEVNQARLLKALKGDALLTVRTLLTHTNDPQKAIDVLEKRYGRPQLILESALERIKKVPKAKEEDYPTLIALANEVESFVNTITSLDIKTELSNSTYLKEVASKLPALLKLQWAEKILGRPYGSITLNEFSEWINMKAEIASVFKPKAAGNQRRRDGVFTTTQEEKKQEGSTCDYCGKGSHNFKVCRAFAALPHQEKIEWVKQKKRCFLCLDLGHLMGNCKNRRECGKDGCSYKHHPLLHRYLSDQSRPHEQQGRDQGGQSQPRSNENWRNPPPNQNHQSTQRGQSSQSRPQAGGQIGLTSQTLPTKKVLLRVAPVTLFNGRNSIQTFALFDEGSQVTLLDEDVANRLGLKGPKKPLSLTWISGTGAASKSRSVDLQIQGRNCLTYEIRGVRTVQNLDLCTQSVNSREVIREWPHLTGVPYFPNNSLCKPTILIGQDNQSLIVPRDLREGPKGAPIATYCKLGWVVHGPTNGFNVEEAPLHSHFCYEEEDSLHQLVKESFSTEGFGVKVLEEAPKSREDKRAIELLNQVTKRLPTGRWETGLLWRNEDVLLPQSFHNALRRLTGIERKLDRDPDFAQLYCDQIEANIEKGFARKLSPQEVNHSGPRTWYLPHFAVTHPQKPGKVRVVFDAAAKNEGVSLNSNLLTGPDLLKSLPGCLFKFREGKIAFSGDIKEMFLQFRLRAEDCNSQRFLWRGMDRDRPPDIYRMEVLIFGSAASPFTAQELKNRNAQKFREEFPEACAAIVDRHYMDDYLDSLDSEEDVIRQIKEVKEVHSRACLEIGKWSSSSRSVLATIRPEDRVTEKKELASGQTTTIERILGLIWDPNADTFSFTSKFARIESAITEGEKTPTKRQMLSLVASLFDPLGLLSTFTVKAKMILQEVWRAKIGWDDEIPSSAMQKWVEWLTELKTISEVSLPRCYTHLAMQGTDIQMHVFCDASEEAFAAVAYLRFERGEEIETALVMARTRVAPLKPMSIPRLELQAAVMGARLAATIQREHRLPIKSTHFWTDSRTVLCWLRADARTFKQFVGHRIGEILEDTDINQWGWVPTKENVADDATRREKPSDFSPKSRWWSGPGFLKLDSAKWPKEDLSKQPQIVEETKKEFLGVIIESPKESLLKVEEFSSYNRLIRVTAWILRWIKRCRGTQIPSSQLTPEEMALAENHWIRKSQEDSFREELAALERGLQLPKQSRLHQLSPYLDEGILKIQGRVKYSPEMSYNARYPAILDPKHPFVRLLVKQYHEKANHLGMEAVLNEIRTRFWILRARAAVRSAWSNCRYCKNQRAVPAVPQMAPLPDFRVTKQLRPFLITGLDYFGPMEVTIGRRHEKRWGALFTCLSTRAVHLELAASLSTDSAIMAIRRFISRRGKPQEIHSDNGTNFHGANNEMKKALEELSQEDLENEMTTRGIRWRFIPPGAPHMGGAWERLVRSVKTALAATLKTRAPKEEVLQTLFAEAEYSINSRPLTRVSYHPDDQESLTPNHFLIGPDHLQFPPGEFSDSDLVLRKQWRMAQRLADHFWSRWVKEYLPTLAPRSKWTQPVRAPAIGDVVVIVDGTLPRNFWPKGVITALHPGPDGKVRVVDIRTASSSYRRPISKIAVLDTSPE